MNAVTLHDFKEWMDMYGEACENGDAKAAAELFAPDAEYYETPFDEPMTGQDSIYRYWSGASQSLKDVQFSYEILAVPGNLGVALWQSGFTSVKSGNHVALDGVFLVELDRQGRCTVFREWWHRQEIGPNRFETA